MFVFVQLLSGFAKTLTYKVPQNLAGQPLMHRLVRVPLRNKIVTAFVIGSAQKLAQPSSFEIREMLDIINLPADSTYHTFIEALADFYFLKPLFFYRRLQSFFQEKQAKEPLQDLSDIPAKAITLTAAQEAVVNYLEPRINQTVYSPTLLHGVTGSGKTEVYKRLIEAAIKQGKSVILLLPEVSLSMQFERKLKQQLLNISIFGFHSTTKPEEKRAVWQAVMEQKPFLLIGVHLPILLPFANLGLIIVDEEHEPGFQEKKHPKLNSKELALWRAFIYKIPILLGSATPSLTSLYQTQNQRWAFFQLKERFLGTFPKIQQVNLIQQKRARTFFWITPELEKAIHERLQKKEQVIIYLNRRGYSFFVQCKGCGHIPQCPNCSVSLTLHLGKKLKDEKNVQTSLEGHTSFFSCHYCSYTKPTFLSCPSCKASESSLLKKGIGTQQIVLMLQKLFPHATVARADLDTSSKKRLWHETVTNFEQGKIDILVGTKTITKGYHFPNVTLVGILWADLNLNFPQYNAHEVTLQQLIQVAGRAGREHKPSTVIVQVIHDHEIFDYTNEIDYLTFANQELAVRAQTLYPPYYRLVQLELQHTKEAQVEKDANILAEQLMETGTTLGLNVIILGPTYPIIQKIQKIEIRHIYLKSKTFKELHQLITNVNREKIKSTVHISVS
ncbi:primosomal protein N' [Candidatus Babeliales bacterium]|nr:primosomal protein N' [Candidatus Babeliales bacterium]